MPRYGTFKYGEGLYGSAESGTLPALLWSILVDWDGDGYFSGDNEASRCSSFNLQRGRRYPLSGNGIQHYAPGKVAIVLDNTDGRFDYFNSSSPIYPHVSPGKFIVIKVLDVAASLNYSVFYGTITEIAPFQSGGIKRVRLVAEDGLRWLENQIIKAQIQISTQIDNIVQDYILPEIGWPTSRWSIQGNQTTRTMNWWWSWDVSALEAINNLADIAAGVFYHSRLGVATFRGGNSTFIRDTIDIDESELLRDISINQPWDTIRNNIQVKVHKKYSIANTDDLYAIDITTGVDGVFVPDSTTTILEIKLESDPGLPGMASFETAARVLDTSDVAQWLWVLSATSTGGAIVARTIRLLKYSSHLKMQVDNYSGSDGWLNGYASPATVVNILEANFANQSDNTSIANFGSRTLTIDTTDVEHLDYGQRLAQYYLDKFKDPAVYPVISLENRPSKQFAPDLFDYRFNLTAPSVGISSAQLFRVGGIEHNWLNENGNAVRTTFWLEPYVAPFVL